MSSRAATTVELRAGEYLLIDVALPGQAPETAGVLLFLPDSGEALLRWRRDWEAFVPADEVDDLRDVCMGLEEELSRVGGEKLLAKLESDFSNTIRVSDREKVAVDSPERVINRLYRSHVQATVQPFQTHLPRYAAYAAAGGFSGIQDVERNDNDWVEAPPGLKLGPKMFVAEVRGRSMEPEIPDGSWCIFRSEVVGSREGRRVLVEDRSASGEGERYTVKIYHSVKRADAESWEHARVTLEPLNPEFEAWELEPDGRYAVIGEFIAVLE